MSLQVVARHLYSPLQLMVSVVIVGAGAVGLRTAQEAHAKRRAEKPEQSTDAKEPAEKSGAESDPLSWLGIAFASHPADAERVRYFQEAARGPR